MAVSIDTIFFAAVLESCAPVVSTFNLFSRLENTAGTLMILQVARFFFTKLRSYKERPTL